jgi:hypothetical protein
MADEHRRRTERSSFVPSSDLAVHEEKDQKRSKQSIINHMDSLGMQTAEFDIPKSSISS